LRTLAETRDRGEIPRLRGVRSLLVDVNGVAAGFDIDGIAVRRACCAAEGVPLMSSNSRILLHTNMAAIGVRAR
jgi:hypothetical protein